MNEQLKQLQAQVTSLTTKKDSFEQDLKQKMGELKSVTADKETLRSDLRRVMAESKSHQSKYVDMKKWVYINLY